MKKDARTRAAGLAALTSVCLLLMAGCGGDDEAPVADCPTGGATGTLALTVDGLGATAGRVEITGPAGRQTLTASGNTTLAAGSYAVSVARVARADPNGRVRTAFSGTADAAAVCVRSGGTAALNVSYTAIASSNKLWSSNANGAAGSQLLGLSSGQLGSSGTRAAAAVTGAPVTSNRGTTFDAAGNLWVVDGVAGDSRLLRFAAATLGASSSATPDRVITGSALNGGIPGANGLAFDAAGNLWFSNLARGVVGRFDAAQLAASGSPAPALEIGGLDGPGALAFDAAGNLWVAAAGAGRVLKFAASSLSNPAATAALTLEVRTPPPVVVSRGSPSGLAFDASGNLWVAYDQDTVVRLTPADQAGSGAVALTPAVQIAVGVTALIESLAFDDSGALWFAHTAGTVARLGPTQLTTSAGSGSPRAPEAVVTVTGLGFAAQLAFYPAPAGLPLHHTLP